MTTPSETDQIKPSANDDSASGRTLAFAVYQRLRTDIINGALLPGTRLRSEFLRERYEVGNSPVREALNRLSVEGLVSREDQKGFRVAAISRSDLEETIETRIKLEEMALREAIRLGDMAWEEQVVLANHRLSAVPQSLSEDVLTINPEWEELHGEFHRVLISACGLRWLKRFCQQLMDHADRYRRLASSTSYSERNEAQEHQAIAEAATGRRADKAVELLHAHYRWTAEIIQKSLPAMLE
jgi:DNA-binding GntR family transcriptional regulator